MGITYKVIPRKNPQGQGTGTKYYAPVNSKGHRAVVLLLSKPAGYEGEFNAGMVERLKVVFRPGKLFRKEPEGAGYIKGPDNEQKGTGLQQKRSVHGVNNIRALLQKGQGLVNERSGQS